MKINKANAPGKSAGVGAVLILVVVLLFLFRRSFSPGYVHFSNDGPLGQQNAAAVQLPEAFLGVWFDNNDIGCGGGAWSVSVSALFHWLVGPVGYAKFLVPFALLVLGLGAWAFFRQLKLTPLAVTLGTLAVALNATFFSTACWGVAPQQVAIGMDFFALALVASLTAETVLAGQLVRLALAGLCVGVNVIEAADIGAIFSLFVSAFVLVHAFNRPAGSVAVKFGRGVGQILLVAVFAGFIAAQTVVSLVGTQIQGVVGMSQDAETKAAHWDIATMWSLPKVETLGLFVPGLFGYKMDTPQNMDPVFKDYFEGGEYWGGMGLDPNWDRYLADGSRGTPPTVQMRQTGGENYAGILVVLVAVWAAARALRKGDLVFSDAQRRWIWFWSAVVILAVLFAWGRFSVFYALLYKLPYFSTIRNPTKFIIVFSWGITVLFAYGIDGLSRRYLGAGGGQATPLPAQPKSWWAAADNFDRKWTWGTLTAVVVSLIAWLVYAGEKPALVHYLQRAPGDPIGGQADLVAAFSINQAGWFVVLFFVAAGLCLLIISGVLAGRRAKFGGLLLGLFLVADLGRANLPNIIYWDYKQKYDIDPNHSAQSTQPVLNFLRDKYYEHRVTELPFQTPEGLSPYFQSLYTIEWMQHQFPYYNIQSLDNWQRPRVGSDIATYEQAVYFRGTPDSIPLLTREWQLTNTRYLLGPAGYLEVLNTQVDPEHHRFKIVQRLGIAPKAGVTSPSKLEEITAAPDEKGDFALFEFTGALPRVKLYANWRVNTNDAATLQTLARPDFDPAQTVLVATPAAGLAPVATNENSGTVEFKNYAPTKVTLAASTPADAVLLWNDKYDPHWEVTVDGQPAPLLRCDFIMRGVFLHPGPHVLQFRYVLPDKPLYVTLTAYGTGLLLLGLLGVAGRGQRRPSIGK